MTEAERKNLEKELKELDEKRLGILTKLEGNKSISPSEVKQLIEMYHGKCFEFEDYENGAVTFIIDTFVIDREEKTGTATCVNISGTFVIYETLDSNILNLGRELYPVGGSLICSGSFDIDKIPGGDDIILIGYRSREPEDTVFERICKMLDGNEIDYDDFIEALEDADENYDYDGLDAEPLGDLDEYSKKRIYGKI